MAIFSVHLSGEIEATAARIKERYPTPGHYQLSDSLYLVRGDTIAQDVAKTVGILEEDDEPLASARGVVFKLNAAYAGWDRRAIWEWLTLGEPLS